MDVLKSNGFGLLHLGGGASPGTRGLRTPAICCILLAQICRFQKILAFSVYKVAIRQAEKSKVSRKRSIIVDCHAIKVRFRLNHKLSPLISVCLSVCMAGWMAVCAEDLHKPLATVCLFFMSHRATERQTESRKAFHSTLGFSRDSHRLEV